MKRYPVDAVIHRLFAPVDAASLAVFRIMFGVLMMWEVVRYIQYEWIYEYYIDPRFYFKYLFFVCFSYVFLLDQARHLNHFYLICLVSFLLCSVGANRWASLDRYRSHRQIPPTVPYWNLFLLRAQVFIVYLYAAIAKLNPDWLRGEPVRSWLAERADMPLVGGLFTQEWVVRLVAYGGIAYDFSICFLMIWPRTRLLGIGLSLIFHATNKLLFHIGVFPYLAFGLTLLFLEPDWPRRVLQGVGRRVKGINRRVGVGVGKSVLTPTPYRLPPTPLLQRRLVLAFVGSYLTAQVLLPLRHWLYPGDVHWTEEGHRFSWRMKLRDKESEIAVRVRDPQTGREWHIDPHEHLSEKQVSNMMGRPDMVIQFAHHLRDQFRRRERVARPQVFVRVLCSLNGAPPRDLIDPAIDLAAEQRTLGTARWILPRSFEAAPAQLTLAPVTEVTATKTQSPRRRTQRFELSAGQVRR